MYIYLKRFSRLSVSREFCVSVFSAAWRIAFLPMPTVGAIETENDERCFARGATASSFQPCPHTVPCDGVLRCGWRTFLVYILPRRRVRADSVRQLLFVEWPFHDRVGLRRVFLFLGFDLAYVEPEVYMDCTELGRLGWLPSLLYRLKPFDSVDCPWPTKRRIWRQLLCWWHYYHRFSFKVMQSIEPS